MLQTFSRMGGTKGQLLLWLLIFSSSHRYCCKNINQLNLTSLPTALITNTPDTRILNLSDNLIEEVDEFPTNDYVEKLFIRRNILKSFPNVVNLDQTLITLDLRENAISYIHPERLRPLFNLQKLILIDNLINDMPDMDPVLGSNIVELKLILNKLTSLPYLPVIGENLQRLDVERNDQLVSADPDVFSAYPKVTYLDVSLCPLGNLPDVHRLPTETHNHALFLKFEGIGMSKMTPEQMAFFDKELWTLDLSDNSIPHIPNMLHLNLSTPIIFLRNPVVCDCRVRWLLYMRDAGLDPAFDLTTVICDRPITLQNQSLASITLADIDCLGKIYIHYDGSSLRWINF